MKKILVFILSSLTGITGITQNYYNNGVPVYSSGITYKVELDPVLLLLNNKTNTLIWDTWTYLDGTKIESDEDENYLNTYMEFDELSFREALKKTFTKSEFDKLHTVNKIKFFIYCVIDNELNIRELAFKMMIYEDSIFLQIPPAKYALLEKNIKKYVKINANEYAKKFKYMHVTKYVDFSKIEIDYGRPTINIGR